MKRVTVNLTIALITFSLGVLSWLSNPLRPKQAEPSEPLRVTVLRGETVTSGLVDYDVLVENVSSKTVYGYSLGFTCRCRSAYGEGIGFLNPVPDRELLKPGESMIQPVWGMEKTREQFKVWVDLVHFTDGTNWGPNNSRTEGYVRALE